MSRKQKDAAVAQSVVRRIGSAEVTGPDVYKRQTGAPVRIGSTKRWRNWSFERK